MADDRLGSTDTDRRGARRLPARPAVVGLVVVLAVLLSVGLVAALRDSPSAGFASESPARTAPRVLPGKLVEMAATPLSSRYSPVTAWTGTELVVVGGGFETACPDGESCPDPALAAERDGAAYDPAADTWRPIADAPGPVDARQVAVWTGEEVVVTATTGVYAYDPDADTWRSLERRTAPDAGGTNQVVPVVTPQGIVYPAPNQPDGAQSLDLVLDEQGTFATLPRDPFGRSWDRSLAWDGKRLWLLSTAAEQGLQRTNDDNQVPARLAVLEGGLADGSWRVVDDETPRMAPEALLWWCEDRLVVDRAGPEEGRTFDRGASSWSRLDAGEASRCALSATERDGLAGGSVYDALGSRFAEAATDCPLVRGVTAYVWAGDDLLVWDSLTGLGCRTGGPPGALTATETCPDRLVSDDRTRSGFGPVEPAARAPSLRAPDAAYLCRYVPTAPPPSLPDEAYTWESDLCCEPVVLTDAERVRLTDYLADLSPPEAGSSCPADRAVLERRFHRSGPRYLVALRTGDDLVGVVLDDFGCDHVRLTDDPFTHEPGSRSGPGGVVPGVLRAPPELVDRLFQALRLRYAEAPRRPGTR